MKLLIFGKLADIAQTSEVEFNINEPIELCILEEEIFSRFPLFRSEKFTIAVNQKIANPNTLINSTDTIALLPPFSGG